MLKLRLAQYQLHLGSRSHITRDHLRIAALGI